MAKKPTFRDSQLATLPGGSDLKACDKSKYSTLVGYADDVVSVLRGSHLDQQ
jgi:hypothetical protein